MGTSNTLTISSAGSTSPIFVKTEEIHPRLLPGILTSLSSGASLTYTIEATADDVQANGYQPNTGNWVPIDSTAVGLTTGYLYTLNVRVTAIRARITTYASGTLTIQLAQ